MSNTWKPIPGAIVFDPEKGQRYVYRNGEWKPVPEWKDEPSPLETEIEQLATNTITCRDCGGKGMVTNSVTGEPDDCYTCGGSGVEDADLALAVEYQRIEDLETENEARIEELEAQVTLLADQLQAGAQDYVALAAENVRLQKIIEHLESNND